VLMNLIALAAMAIVAYMGLVQGLHRSAQTLVILVLAGAIAFGLLGPASGLLANPDPKSTWYYAADPFCLWVLFCLFFLLLRVLAAKMFANEPDFPPLLNQLGGALFGLGTGYLAVGICVLLVQMLPTPPEPLGYEVFSFKRGEEEQPDSIAPGQPLWLAWDRGTLALFGYLSTHPLGSDEASFYRRYGDVYPPPYRREADYKPVLNVDDVLYQYWFRRWEFFGPSSEGPIRQAVRGRSEGPGVRIDTAQGGVVSNFLLRPIKVERVAVIEPFPQDRPPAGHEFLLLTLRFKPEGRLPRTIDSAQFCLIDTLGPRLEPPMVFGRAKAGPPNHAVAENSKPSAMTARGTRFNIPPGVADGFYLAAGASFAFTEAQQIELRTLVFAVPKQRSNDRFQLTVLSAPAPSKAPAREAAPAAPAPPTAPAGPLTAERMLGPWEVDTPGVQADFEFKNNGTVAIRVNTGARTLTKMLPYSIDKAANTVKLGDGLGLVQQQPDGQLQIKFADGPVSVNGVLLRKAKPAAAPAAKPAGP